MPVSLNTEHWIRPDALTVNLNHFGDPDYLQVSVLAGAVVMAFKQDVIPYNAAHNYRTWPIDASNTYLENSGPVNVYARLTRSEVNARAVIIYDPILRDIEGREISYSTDGVETVGSPSDEFFYIFLGRISSSVSDDGKTIDRVWLEELRFGSLNTNQQQNEVIKGDWEKMFRLNKVFDMIEPLKTFINGSFRKLFINDKEITDIQRSVEHDEEIVSDTRIPSVSYMQESSLSKTKDDRSKGKIATDKAIEVGNYVSGASGAIIYKDMENGQTVGELDKLYVRVKAYFETLEIINVNTVGGKQILSPAGSIKCIGVSETENEYLCYFLAEQDGEKIENRWQQGDQAYSQTFNAKEGVSNKVSNTYYWRLVTSVSNDAVEFEGKQCHFVGLSKTDCDKGSDIPKTGDIINHRGSRTDIDRMNFIEQSSVDAFSPNITLFHGVNSYSLDGKAYVSYGVDKSTNKAFMDVYGDMYVGDRQGGSYMRYTQENGLEISGTLSVGTKLGDKNLQELINSATPEGYQEFVEKVTQDIEGLQNQIDGAIDSYFYQYNPTLDNYPAMDWVANGTEKAHLNDTFTNLTSGYSWRWSLDGTTYKWVEITDTATTKALAMAGKAQDTADGKRRVFVETPYPPYDKGDLWSRGSDYPLMICVNPKSLNQTYEVSDFGYADNNAKLKEEMQELVNDTKDDLNNAIGQATEAANKYADKGISAAEQALNASINALNQAKANVSEVYSKAEADGKISESETNAINAAKAQADAAIALSETTIKAYADGVVDEEEAARIKQAQENLEAAKKYADEAAQAVEDEINNNYGYLSQALNKAPQTEVKQGLVLTSLIQMRNTSSSIMSGLNGLYGAKKEKSIATWWGGDMHDLEEYYTWNGTEWVVKSNVTVPTNIPSGLIRFDGTGYLAKGKFWWDNEGKIYADPTALFLMFDVEDEAKSLSSTILAMMDKQAEFESMWSIKTDANGKKYLYSTFDLVTQGGVSIYTNAEGLNLPSIYNGLPIDGNTIYWENGVLKAKGGSGIIGATTLGGLSNVGTWADSVADVDRIMYQAAGSSNWVSKNLSDLELKGDYLPLSGGTISGTYGALIIHRTNGNSSLIKYSNTSGVLGYLGFTSSKEPFVYKGTNTNSNAQYKIWHEGNFNPSDYLLASTYTASDILSKLLTVDGSGSGLDADTLDGYHANVDADANTVALRDESGALSAYGFKSKHYQKTINAEGWYRIYTGDNSSKGFNQVFLQIGRTYSNSSGESYSYSISVASQKVSVTRLSGTYNTHLITKIRIAKDTSQGVWYIDYYRTSATSNPDCISGVGSGTFQTPTLVEEVPLYSCEFDTGYGCKSETYQISDTGNTYQVGFIGKLNGNASSATKLETPRKIWGQSFDGSANVTGDLVVGNGDIYLSNNKRLRVYPTSGSSIEVFRMATNNSFIFGNGASSNGYNTYLYGTNLYFRNANGIGIALNSSGNVLIGTDTDSGYKLDVNGNIRGSSIHCSNTYINTGGNGIYFSGSGIYYHNGNNAWVSDLIAFDSGSVNLRQNTACSGTLSVSSTSTFAGNVGIGTKNPAYKLDVNGTIHTNSSLWIDNIEVKKSQDDVLYIDANVVVRGGITMYGTNSVNVPTIMDAIATDNVNLKVVDGVLTFVGQTGGGVADSVAWANVTGKPTTLSGYGITDAVGYANSITADKADGYKWIGYGRTEGGFPINGGAIKVGINNYQMILHGRNGVLRFNTVEAGTLQTWRQVWHDGNFNPSNYLPLTGGTIKTENLNGLTIKRSSSDYSVIRYMDNTELLGYIGVGSTSEIYSKQPVFIDSGIKVYKIWHSGNDGSGSGLDADLLDGYHVDSLFKGVYDANINFNSFSDDSNANNFYYIHDGLNQSNKPYYYGGLLQLGISTMNVQVGFDYQNAACLRTRWWSSNGYDWSSWRDFAFTDSNVASATKLQTARTIWGQSFDGTGNVDGILTLNYNSSTAGIELTRAGSNECSIAFNNGYGRSVIGSWDGATTLWVQAIGNVMSANMTTGYVGIGTTSPSRNLHIVGSMVTEGGSIEAFQSVDGLGKYAFIKINEYYTHGNEEWASYIVSDYYGTNWCATGGFTHGMYFKSGRYGFDNFIFLDSRGNPVARLSTTSGSGNHLFMGNVLASGGFTMYSDQRKKTILNHVELSLKDIANAPLIEHYYNSDDAKTTHVGSIAQYWASMNDWFCKLDNEGFYTMEIQNCALASAISIARELDRYESKTDKTIKQLKKRICQLEEEVERLRAS